MDRVRIIGATNILQRVDSLGCLFNLTTNNFRNKLGGKLRKGAAGRLALDDFSHLLPNSTDLRRPGVGGLLDLVGTSLGKGDSEQAKKIVIRGLHSDVGFDQGLPLANQGSQLVGCEVQSVEVGQAVLPLNFIHTELDLAKGVVLVVLQVSERDLEDSALERIIRILQTTGAVDECLSDTFNWLVSCRRSFSVGKVHTRGSGKWRAPCSCQWLGLCRLIVLQKQKYLP